MRITNILPRAQFFSYASSTPGGRMLESGGTTPPLPFKLLCLDQLWRDLRSDKIRIRLDKGDLDFIADITKADAQPIVVKKHPPKVKLPVKPKALPKPKLPVHAAPKKAVAGQPVFEPITPVTAEQIRSGKISIQDLQRQNTLAPTVTPVSGVPGVDNTQKASLREIAEHMKGRL